MAQSYKDLLAFVQYLSPTWRKTQHINLALFLQALLQRPSLCLSELARAYPSASQPLHGRLKRLTRFVGNPNLDEGALFVRGMKLSYRFGDDPPNQQTDHHMLPILLDTTYFEPFALLIATIPCGSRGLPVALSTYHRTELKACFPSETTRPRPNDDPSPPRPRRGHRYAPAASTPTSFLGQNHIEEEIIDYVFSLVSSALRGVLVADRGFARASLFQRLETQQRDFVIRIDAQTHIGLPSPLAHDRPTQGLPADVLGLQPGQRLWCPHALYGKQERVPIKLLAVWDEGQKEPWYLATSLTTPDNTETMYRWRMRLECANRDEKTGVLLRESGDKHAMKNVLHLHRLMLGLAVAEWLCALTGLQAWRDLPESDGQIAAKVCSDTTLLETVSLASSQPDIREQAMPESPTKPGSEVEEGPALPPPVLPHRGQVPKLPQWMKRFAVRGHLSYVRLGMEVLRSPDLRYILTRLVRWLGAYLSPWTPLWRPYQIRYRLKHWWGNSS